MNEISQPTQKLIQRYQNWYRSLQPKEGEVNIHVDEVASKVAAFYEKIRGVLDWREEHLLRRAGIERNLKRRLLLNQNGKELAVPFVYEMIRGGHFPNDRILEQKIEEIEKLINKYVYILNHGESRTEKAKMGLYDWLLAVAACEVEEILDPQRKERALIDYMEELMKEKIVAPEGVSEQEKNIQVSIAVQKALFKLDKPIISYHLLKKLYPQWMELTPPLLEEIAKNIYSIWEKVEKDLKHHLTEKFYVICERYDTPYLLLGDIISENPNGAQEKLEKPENAEKSIREAYSRRMFQLKSRVRRAAFYSTVSIFATKMLLALAVEIPFDKYVIGTFDPKVLGFNIAIPPLIMFLLILTIRPPGKSNLEMAVMETIKIIYKSDKKESYEIRSRRKRGFFINMLITLFYLISFVISFGLIYWGLKELNFGILSMAIFVVFLSLISFAGVKVRERSKELLVEKEKEGFLTFIADSFSMPFIRVGKWLSGQWARYNIVLLITTALIDMPLLLFIEFIEQWRFFLKEKKEEIH